MNNVKMIAEQIKTTIAPVMDRWVDDRVVQLVKLKTEITEISKSEEFNKKFKECRSRDRYYSMSSFTFHWFESKGVTKGDYMLAVFENPTGIREKMEKEAANKLKKIDHAVAKKIDFEVDTIENLTVCGGKDGFIEGAWKLNGKKIFSFETFYAGGYNIQCFHIRTKYKLK